MWTLFATSSRWRNSPVARGKDMTSSGRWPNPNRVINTETVALATLKTENAVAPTDLFERCRQFTTAREVMAMGIYPYFRVISSAPGTVVTVDGHELLMIGSN